MYFISFSPYNSSFNRARLAPGISPQFFVIVPLMLQERFIALWDRLVESGIDRHVGRQTVALYKTKRTEWLRRLDDDATTTARRLALRDDDGDGGGGGSQMVLFGVVLGIGWSVAGLGFLLEHLIYRTSS